MVRIVLLGPPGAGKGTQARDLAAQLGVPHVSTGDLLRANVARHTSLGEKADRFMRAGDLVPDALTLGMLQARLREDDARAGFVLDGFPRTLAQAQALDQITPLDHVVAFEIPDQPLVERLTERRSCPKCGRVYNLQTLPPLDDNRCDVDGTPLTHRSDDRAEAVERRLAVYREQTAPLLRYYDDRRLLRRIDARGSVETVHRRLLDAVATAGNPSVT